MPEEIAILAFSGLDAPCLSSESRHFTYPRNFTTVIPNLNLWTMTEILLINYVLYNSLMSRMMMCRQFTKLKIHWIAQDYGGPEHQAMNIIWNRAFLDWFQSNASLDESHLCGEAKLFFVFKTPHLERLLTIFSSRLWRRLDSRAILSQ